MTNGRLIAVDCVIRGGSMTSIDPTPSYGGVGVRGNGATVLLHQCQVQGGDATPGSGGAGVDLIGSFARVAGDAASYVRGGLGQTANGVPGGGMALSFRADPASSASVHAQVQVSGISGNVNVGAPALPRLDVTGTANSSGELLAGQPVSVTVGTGLANAPVALGFAPVPLVSNALAPLTLGETVLPIPAYRWLLPSDALGRLQLTFGPTVTPALVGVPVFAQAGVLDCAGGLIRMSNPDVHLFTR